MSGRPVRKFKGNTFQIREPWEGYISPTHMVGISGKLHMRIADLRGLSGTWAPRADMGTACTLNRLHCAPFPHTDPLQRVGQTNKKSRLFSRQKSFRKYSCYNIFSHNSLFFNSKNYDKEMGKCDPYSGGKSSQKKMTSSGPRCCFAQAQTSSYEMLKDKRKWCLKN